SGVCPTPEIQTRPALRLVLETAPPATHSHLPARSLSACRKSARNLRSSPDRATAPEVNREGILHFPPDRRVSVPLSSGSQAQSRPASVVSPEPWPDAM